MAQNPAGRETKNTEGSRPMMATYSPRVEIDPSLGLQPPPGILSLGVVTFKGGRSVPQPTHSHGGRNDGNSPKLADPDKMGIA